MNKIKFTSKTTLKLDNQHGYPVKYKGYLIGDEIYSYHTNVASIKGNKLKQHGWWSVTTQKHINYVAKELNLKLIK